MNKRSTFVQAFSLSLLLSLLAPLAMANEAKPGMITESYYRVKWGYFDEFMALFKKNHYPILKELQRLGHISDLHIDYPINHASEESRWDVRVAMTIHDTDVVKREMPRISQQIYPDLKQLKAEETQRMRLLLAHQDIMIRRENLADW